MTARQPFARSKGEFRSVSGMPHSFPRSSRFPELPAVPISMLTQSCRSCHRGRERFGLLECLKSPHHMVFTLDLTDSAPGARIRSRMPRFLRNFFVFVVLSHKTPVPYFSHNCTYPQNFIFRPSPFMRVCWSALASVADEIAIRETWRVRCNVTLLNAIPALPVLDIGNASRYYTDRLGFTLVHADDGFAVLVRDNVRIHLWAANDPNTPGAGTASGRLSIMPNLGVRD